VSSDEVTPAAEPPDPEVTAVPDATAAPARPRLSRTRSITAWVLVVLVSVLFPLSVMTVWVVNIATNTDRYVETLAPIATNPVVISHASVRITDELFSSVNVNQKLASLLPPKAKPVAVPLTNTMQNFVGKQVNRVLSSTYFQKLWNNGNRRAHATMVAVLSGQDTKLTRALKNGKTVVVNITPVATKVINTLDGKGITFFDPLKTLFNTNQKNVSVSILSAQQVSQAQGIFNLVKKLKWLVPIITLVLAAVAVAVAVRRRKTLLRLTVGGSIGIVVFLTALHLARKKFVSTSVKEGFNSQVSGIIFDTLLRFLKDGLWLVLAILLVASVVLWFVGPARYAVALRHQIARAWHWLARNARQLTSKEHTEGASPAAQRSAGWIREHRTGLRLLGALVAGLFIVFNGSLTFWGALVTLLILAAYLGLLQLVVIWAERISGGTGAAASAGVTDAGAASVGSGGQR
jgi:cell division protein FtsL